jgi:hypothetical protein
MTPTPDPDKVTAAQARIADAKTAREKAHAQVDHDFWQVIADEIAAGNCRQTDAAAVTGYSREYIRRELKGLADTSN